MFGSSRGIAPILQSQITECGLACFAMISQHFGSDLRISYLRSRYEVDEEYGMSLLDLKTIAADFSIATRAVKFEPSKIHLLKPPCILHWGNNHFVVLEKCRGSKIDIIDPASGSRTVSLRNAQKKMSGYALEFNSTGTTRSVDEGGNAKLSLGSIRKQAPFFSNRIALACVVGVSIELVALITPVYMQLAIDEITTSLNLNFIVVLASLFCLVFLIDAVFRMLRDSISVMTDHSLRLNYTDLIASRLLSLPYSFFNKRFTGDLMARLESIEAVSTHVTLETFNVIVSALAATAALGLMFFIDFKMALFSLAVLVVISLIRILTFKPMYSALNQHLVAHGKAKGILTESIEGIHSLKFSGFAHSRHAQWQRQFAKSVAHSQRGALIKAVYDTSTNLVINLERTFIVVFACYVVVEGELTVGVLYAYIQYKALFSGHILQVINFRMARSLIDSHLNRLEDIVLAEPEVTISKTQKPDVTFSGPVAVTAKGLTWSPPLKSEPILKSVDFSIEAGRTAIIRGQSGAGKSTFLSLMYGNLRPNRGQLFFDDVDVCDIPLKVLNEKVSVVTPDDRLFTGTILENIVGDATQTNYSRVRQVALQAGILDRIASMPNQVHTLVQDSSSFLSTGERQRLLLARALYKPSVLLILDEFSSSLDDQTARDIWENVIAIKDRTILLATHKPQLVEDAGQHFEVVQGRLVAL